MRLQTLELRRLLIPGRESLETGRGGDGAPGSLGSVSPLVSRVPAPLQACSWSSSNYHTRITHHNKAVK